MPAVEHIKTLRPDSKGRVTLGEWAKGTSGYRVCREPSGRIVMDPMVEIPASEAWLWQNSAALESVKRGLMQSAQGNTRERGSFARYAEDGE